VITGQPAQTTRSRPTLIPSGGKVPDNGNFPPVTTPGGVDSAAVPTPTSAPTPVSGDRNDTPLLMAVPNVSEGRDGETIAAVGTAYSRGGAHLLGTHQDHDHRRSVHTLAARQGELAYALAAGAAEAARRIDLTTQRGLHPHVGAIDVCPV